MDDGGPTASIICFALLLMVDVFFYGFGAAITSLNGKDLLKHASEEKGKRTKRLENMMLNPAPFINTVQLAAALTHIIMGWFYLGIWRAYIRKFILNTILRNLLQGNFSLSAGTAEAVSFTISLIGLIYIVLTFGVLIPKKLAAKYPDRWAYACVTPAYYITKFLSPLTGFVTWTANGILRLFGVKMNEDNADVTEEEIISMVNEGHEQGVILASEAEMITNIFELGDKEARDIMTHRNNMIAIDGVTPLKEALRFMLAEKNSRYPVYEENIDHIIGILHLKDAMRIHDNDSRINIPIRKIDGLVRKAMFIPETRNIDSLFKAMQSTKTQMVIVIDEYGQTSGLIAMEDILEEIVGNIQDEYDEDEEHIEEKSEDEYIIDGKTPLEELEERFNISFREEEFETLNGFLISKLDRIPEEDEEFEIDVEGYHFKILKVENNMIQSVLVTKLAEEDIREEDPDIEEEKK